MNRAFAQRYYGLNGVDGNKFIPAGSLLLYSVTYNDVAFGINWGMNWFYSNECRQAAVDAIRATNAFNSVSVIPGNFTQNNCSQAQIQVVTAFDWNLGDIRWNLDKVLSDAGFEINASNLTVTTLGESGDFPVEVKPGTQTASPISKTQNPNADKSSLPNQQVCNWDTQSIGEYLACQLGFNSTSTATVVVIGGLLLFGIVLLKR